MKALLIVCVIPATLWAGEPCVFHIPSGCELISSNVMLVGAGSPYARYDIQADCKMKNGSLVKYVGWASDKFMMGLVSKIQFVPWEKDAISLDCN